VDTRLDARDSVHRKVVRGNSAHTGGRAVFRSDPGVARQVVGDVQGAIDSGLNVAGHDLFVPPL
jgi:hypothetical protein